MPTRKDMFLTIRDKLKTSITSVNNNVFPTYPLKEPQLPFIVVDVVGKSFEEYSIDDTPNLEELNVEIYVYTKTKENCDVLLEEIENVIRTNDFYGSMKDIQSMAKFIDLNDMSGMHEGAVRVTFRW